MNNKKYVDYKNAISEGLKYAKALERFEKIPLEKCINRVLFKDIGIQGQVMKIFFLENIKTN